jgi:predicted MPP superfamily phosphohydrolase
MRFLFVLLAFFLLDFYASQVLKAFPRAEVWARWVWWGSTALVWAGIVASFFYIQKYGRSEPPSIFSYIMVSALLVYVPKMVMVLPLLAEDLFRLGQWGYRLVHPEIQASLPGRRQFISTLALGLAAIPFASILHGVWKGRYRYRVIDLELAFDDLPEAFDGYKIVQISDLHTGSFDHREKVKYGLDLLQQQQADALLFTGDMVNNTAKELEGWEDLYTALSAKDAKLSVLGNHDYGDYVGWASEADKQANMQRLQNTQRAMGFDLLLNEHRVVERNGQKLYLAGVENWGKPPFPQKGDLKKALAGIPDDGFVVLMSHDPSHFDLEVKQHPKKVHITLSGHTHGMQFGIEIPGWIKWSPVKFRYPKWAGLYEDLGRFLYVNRGFGYLAFPGRVGIWPEITAITLRRKA